MIFHFIGFSVVKTSMDLCYLLPAHITFNFWIFRDYMKSEKQDTEFTMDQILFSTYVTDCQTCFLENGHLAIRFGISSFLLASWALDLWTNFSNPLSFCITLIYDQCSQFRSGGKLSAPFLPWNDEIVIVPILCSVYYRKSRRKVKSSLVCRYALCTIVLCCP